MGDNPTDSAHALLLYEKYDIENFMYQNEDGGWECLTRVSNRWRTDNCFSPSGKSYWHFCLTTQVDHTPIDRNVISDEGTFPFVPPPPPHPKTA